MRNLVIANPRAAAGKVGKAIVGYERAVSARFGDCEVRLSGRSGGVTELVREGMEAGDVALLAVVGGDGTLNEAVNGLAEFGLGDGLPPLLFLPAGTGGDFSRSIGTAGRDLDEILEECEPRTIDAGRVEISRADGTALIRHFLNIASLGVSADIADRVNRGTKWVGGRVAFATATIASLARWRDRRIRLRIDDEFDRELNASLVVAANGRFFGGGMMVAPEAILDDGLFDVVFMEDLGALKFAANSNKVYKGKHLGVDGISYMRGERVVVEPVDGAKVLLETDGEIPGHAPVTISIVPKALELMAPWGRAGDTIADARKP